MVYLFGDLRQPSLMKQQNGEGFLKPLSAPTWYGPCAETRNDHRGCKLDAGCMLRRPALQPVGEELKPFTQGAQLAPNKGQSAKVKSLTSLNSARGKQHQET